MHTRLVPVVTAILLTTSLAACGSSGSKASSTPSTTAVESTSTAVASSSSVPQIMTPNTSASPVTHKTITKTVTAAAPAPTTQQCGTASETDAVNAHIGSLAPPFPGDQWIIDTAQSNTYKPCSSLSFVPLSFMGATGDSPEQIMLFHYGTYLGTATAKGYPLTDIEQNGDNSIRVQYVDGNHNTYWTTFTYTGGKPSVSMTGTDPSTLH